MLAVVGSPLGHCVGADPNFSLALKLLAVVGSPLGHCVRRQSWFLLIQRCSRSGWLSAWPLRSLEELKAKLKSAALAVVGSPLGHCVTP